MMAPEERTKAKELYRQGLNDREIAEKMGLKREAITYWRVRQGLPSYHKGGRRPKMGMKCTHDNCFTCPYVDCVWGGPFPTDKVYQQMVNAGRNSVPDKERLKDYDEP